MSIPSHTEIEKTRKDWLRAARAHPFKTAVWLLGFVLLSSFVIVVTSYLNEKGAQLARVEDRVGKVERTLSSVATAMETLVVAQEIQALGARDTILLDYEPVPKSVRIICGPLTSYPREGYGYRMEGRTIQIVHSDTLKMIKNRLPGGVTVEYLRRIRSE